ncbi:MAG TPA: 3'-5' exonuclease [Flavobacteriales bacterium]|jgi:DNA polymerase-3 subunit epsilon|nr:3'-5' exonuclease [Flavobacteriales bacterium]
MDLEAALKNLHLKRPLVVFDLETTGVQVGTDRIVEIAMIKISPDGSVVRKPEKAGNEYRILVNPEIPIPLESSLVHGVYDDDVKSKHTFGVIAPGLVKFLHNCDLGGFNSNRFDVPMLAEEFLRVGVDFGLEGRNLIDVQNIFHKMEQRTLKAAYRFYCDKELEGAHEAYPDTAATLEILVSQLEKYADATISDSRGETVGPVPSDMDELHKFCQRTHNADLAGRLIYNDDGVIVFNFGKNKGVSVKELIERDPGYFGWMMKGDFPRYTKRVLEQIKEGTLK